MLDQQSKTVYEALKKLTGEDDIYKIIEAEEILDLLSSDINKVQLSAVIRDLRDREYIKVKYFTPDEYCLLTVKRAEEIAAIVEEVVAVNAPVKKEEKNLKENVTVGVRKSAVFWAAFFGSVLGGALISAIALILQKFLF